MFLVKKDNLRGSKGLILECDNAQWKEVVRLFLTEQYCQKRPKEYKNDENSRKAKRKYDFTEGPMASDKGDFKHPEAIENWIYT